jgi:hypothetical protein
LKTGTPAGSSCASGKDPLGVQRCSLCVWLTTALPPASETCDDAPILKSWRRPQAGEASSSTSSSTLAEPKQNGKPHGGKAERAVKPPKRHRLPPFLRFRFPLNLLFYLVLPLLLPLALSLVLYRFGRESRRSRKRLQGADSESLWARIREVEQALETKLEDGLARAEADDAGTPVKSAEGKPVSGLRLTESQRAMIRSLDQLPSLEKVRSPARSSLLCGMLIVNGAPSALRLVPGDLQLACCHYRPRSGQVSRPWPGQACDPALDQAHALGARAQWPRGALDAPCLDAPSLL